MDINVIRGIFTLLLMLIFVGICLWAYSRARKTDFAQAANLPLEEDSHE